MMSSKDMIAEKSVSAQPNMRILHSLDGDRELTNMLYQAMNVEKHQNKYPGRELRYVMTTHGMTLTLVPEPVDGKRRSFNDGQVLELLNLDPHGEIVTQARNILVDFAQWRYDLMINPKYQNRKTKSDLKKMDYSRTNNALVFCWMIDLLSPKRVFEYQKPSIDTLTPVFSPLNGNNIFCGEWYNRETSQFFDNMTDSEFMFLLKGEPFGDEGCHIMNSIAHPLHHRFIVNFNNAISRRADRRMQMNMTNRPEKFNLSQMMGAQEQTSFNTEEIANRNVNQIAPKVISALDEEQMQAMLNVYNEHLAKAKSNKTKKPMKIVKVGSKSQKTNDAPRPTKQEGDDNTPKLNEGQTRQNEPQNTSKLSKDETQLEAQAQKDDQMTQSDDKRDSTDWYNQVVKENEQEDEEVIVDDDESDSENKQEGESSDTEEE